jgi:VWFA-related protein
VAASRWFFFFPALLAAAQEPAPIRVTTRMVQLTVVVHDKTGKAATGLGREDFRIFDSGREQEIRSFSVDGGEPLREARKLPPDTFSNRLSGGTRYSTTVILVDHFNTRWSHEGYGRLELMQFFREIEPSHRIALLSLAGELRVLHDFTTDTASLLQTLENYRPKRPIIGGTFRAISSVPSIRKLDMQTEAAKAAERAKVTANAVDAVVKYLSQLPGRKNLIWLSTTFPGSLARVRHDDIALYPIDVRGVEFPSGGEVLSGPLIDEAHYSARALATYTGGVAYYNGNDVRAAIRRAYEDARGTYVLGYYPSHGEWNGAFHPVKVTVNRPGLRIRHRAGYTAVPEHPFVERNPEQILHEAVRAPLDATGIGFDVSVLPLKDGALSLTLAIDPRTLTFEPRGERYLEELDFLVVAQRENGEDFPSVIDTSKLDVPKEAYLRLQEESIVLRKRFEPPDGAHRLRVVVRETRTGALGSLTVPLAKSRPKTISDREAASGS